MKTGSREKLLILTSALAGFFGFWIFRWKRRDRNATSPYGNLDDVVNDHIEYLREPFHSNNFKYLLDNDPEAAKGEAVLRYCLASENLNPEPGETKEHGGLDFRCQPKNAVNQPIKGKEFWVEVTSLRPDVVERHSGWPNTIEEGAGAFSIITEQLRRKIGSKIEQIRKHDQYCLLAITSTHIGSSALLSRVAAQMFLSAGEEFFQNWREISAILLVSVSWDCCQILGVLNPEAHHPFDIGYLGEVPFLRARDWPPNSTGDVKSDWVVGYPPPLRSDYLFFPKKS